MNKSSTANALYELVMSIFITPKLESILEEGGGFVNDNYFVWPLFGYYYTINPFQKLISEVTTRYSDPQKGHVITDEELLVKIHEDIMNFLGSMNFILRYSSSPVSNDSQVIPIKEFFFKYVAELLKNPFLVEILPGLNAKVVDNYLVWQIEDEEENVYMAANPHYKELRQLSHPDQPPVNGLEITDDEDFVFCLDDLTSYIYTVNELTAFNCLPFPAEAKMLGATLHSVS